MRLLLVAIYFNRATRADWNDRHAFNSEERLKEVSLDRATDDGWSVYRAEKSQPWPGEASAEISLIWIGHPGRGELRVLNGSPVAAIRPNLEATSRVTGSPYSLNENSGIAFKGCEPIGMGFFVEDAVARSLKMEDPTSAYVIFPYLSGDDLNSSWDLTASRLAINFGSMTEMQACRYRSCWRYVEKHVLPGRLELSENSFLACVRDGGNTGVDGKTCIKRSAVWIA